MELVLWRHCDAESTLPDESRRLTARGRDEAARVARWLLHRLPADCRILVSPALRAQQTAQALGRPFETSEALAPGATVDDVLRGAGWPDAAGTTLVVGHEPTLGTVAGDLLDLEDVARPLAKGEVVWLRSRLDMPGQATVVATTRPDAIPRRHP